MSDTTAASVPTYWVRDDADIRALWGSDVAVYIRRPDHTGLMYMYLSEEAAHALHAALTRALTGAGADAFAVPE